MASENAGYAVLTVIPSVRGIGAQMGTQLNNPVVKAARRAGDDAGATLASRAASSVRSGAGQISSAFSTVAAGAAAAGGAALASGFATALDLSAAQGRIQAQLGVSEKEAGRIGTAAGDVYARGFGASMPEVSDAVGAVIQQMQFMRDASSADLQEVSRQAMTAADVLNVDVSRAARAAGQMVKTGLAADAEEAFDILVSGAQSGANAADDLADTYAEYSTQFRNMGLSGADTIGLMTQGLNAGARDADTVADAIKEFSIEAVAGSDRVRAGFESLGLDADGMFARIAEGGPSARGALDETLESLKGVENETERNAIATDLFGTKAEDLGASLYELDLSSAAEGMGDMAAAASDAADAVEETDAAKLASAWRELKTELGTQLIPVLTQVATWVTNNMDVVKGAAVAVGVLGAAWATYRVAATAATVATGAWSVGKGIVQGAGAGAQALGRMRDGFTSTAAAQSAFSGKMGTAGGVLRRAWDGAAGAVRGAGSAITTAASTAGGAVTRAASTAATAARSGWDTLRLRAMYAGDAIRGAGTKAATAAKSGITAAGTAARTAGTAALTSARHWTTLAVAQTRSAVAAGRARVATIATAVAQRTIRAASLAWTAAQWLLNVALTANPIGLIVLGIGLLIGAVIVAYNKVGWFRAGVDAVFKGIGAVATWLWDKAIKPAFDGISWGIDFVRKNLWVLLGAGPIGWVIGFGIAIYKNFDKIIKVFRLAGTVTLALWNKYARPPLTALRNFVVGHVLAGFTRFQAGVSVATSKVKTAISTAVSGGRTALGWLRTGIGATKDAFDRGQEGIGKALGKIRTAAKAPVKFFVESAYNEGIRPVWNWVADKVGLKTLDKVKLPKGFARGGILPGRSSWRHGDTHLRPMREGEGVAISEAMAVPALRNELLRWNSIGLRGGTAALQQYANSGGGAAFAGTPRRVRAMGEGLGYAQGGIVEAVAGFGKSVVKGFLTGGLSGAVDKVAAPLVNVIKEKFGRTGIRGLPTRGAEYLVGGLKKTLKGFAGSLEISNGGAANWVGLEGAPARLQRAARWVDTQVGKPYQWGGGGNPSWDCSGFMAGIENTIRGLRPARRYTTMDFRGARAPSGWVRNLRSPFEVGVMNGGSARGSHMSGTLLGVNVESSGSRGVHKGTRARGAGNSLYTDRYGFAPVAYSGGIGSQASGPGGAQLYDDGGWLTPGYTVVENRTGAPEAVYTSAQQDRIDRMIAVLERQGHRTREGHTFHITGSGDGRRVARHVVTALSDWERLHPVP